MKKYYYSDGQQQFGPLSKKELKSNNITKETLVWYDGLKDWTKAGEVEELADLFPVTPPPPPLPKQKTATPPSMPENKTVTPPPMPNIDDGKIKRKPKKLLIIASVIIGLVIIVGVLITIQSRQKQKEKEEFERIEAIKQEEQRQRDEEQRLKMEKQISQERLNPENYLSLTNVKLKNGNLLTGYVNSKAQYVWYKQIQIKVIFYDGNNRILQSDIYHINGDFSPNSKKTLQVTIKEIQGVINSLKWESFNAIIIGAKPN
jgi:hypothetical protein